MVYNSFYKPKNTKLKLTGFHKYKKGRNEFNTSLNKVNYFN